MIQSSKILDIVVKAINAASTSPDQPLKFIRLDTPLTVRVHSITDGFVLTDEHHSIPAEFSIGAIFWYKRTHKDATMKALKDKHIVLNDYMLASCMDEDKKVKICFKIYNFAELPSTEITEKKSPAKSIKNILEEKEMEEPLDLLARGHCQRSLKKKNIEVPNLEDIIFSSGKGSEKKASAGKASGKKGINVIPDIKGDKESEEDSDDPVVEFKDLEKTEKELEGDIELIKTAEESNKEKIAAGSEGELDRKGLLKDLTKKFKNKYISKVLETRGLLEVPRPSKASPKKKGRIPTGLKEAIEEATKKIMAGKPKTGKRNKPEGKKAKNPTRGKTGKKKSKK